MIYREKEPGSVCDWLAPPLLLPPTPPPLLLLQLMMMAMMMMSFISRRANAKIIAGQTDKGGECERESSARVGAVHVSALSPSRCKYETWAGDAWPGRKCMFVRSTLTRQSSLLGTRSSQPAN